jgi:hypothetical protein
VKQLEQRGGVLKECANLRLATTADAVAQLRLCAKHGVNAFTPSEEALRAVRDR